MVLMFKFAIALAMLDDGSCGCMWGMLGVLIGWSMSDVGGELVVCGIERRVSAG